MSREAENNGAGRTWRGVSAEERRLRRRESLIEAGIELFGTQGYASTPVKAVCSQAGLTERYFYEAFDDREGLLAAIYGQLVEATQARTRAAIETAPDELYARLGVGLEAFFAALAEDPRGARIQEIETVGVSERMEALRREALSSYAALIADQVRREPGWDPAGDPAGDRTLEVVTLGLVGGVNEQLVALVLGDLDVSAEELLRIQRATIEAVIGGLLGR